MGFLWVGTGGYYEYFLHIAIYNVVYRARVSLYMSTSSLDELLNGTHGRREADAEKSGEFHGSGVWKYLQTPPTFGTIWVARVDAGNDGHCAERRAKLHHCRRAR